MVETVVVFVVVFVVVGGVGVVVVVVVGVGCSCDAADAGLSLECFNWGGFELSYYHPQGFVLATLQLLDAGRGGPRLPRWSRVG